MSKLALNMIVKDDTEKELLVRCLNSIAKYVDGIFVTTTNKPDTQIKKIIKNYGGVTSFYKWDKSFEKARNYALKQVPEEYDYIVWCDTDDIWQNAELLPEMVKVMDAQKLTSIFFDYNYQINPQTGKVEIVHPRERIVRRGYYEWKGHLHETLIPTREANNGYFKDVKVNHFPPKESFERNNTRNLEILEETYKNEGDKHDPRTEYYLARNYFDVEDYDKAYKIFKDYLKHSGWDEERCLARNYMGLIKLFEGDTKGAEEEFLRALGEFKRIRTVYINLAYALALQEKYDDAEVYARIFVQMPEHKSGIVQVPIDDEIHYFETMYMIAMGRKKTKLAIEALEELVKIVPQSEEFKTKLMGAKRLEELIEATRAVETLQKELLKTNELEKISTLLNALPSSIEGNAYVEQIRQKFNPPKNWNDKSIVIWAGRSFEEWSPDSLKTGLGGSETAIVQLAKNWRAMGYNVTVYGNPGAIEGDYGGVEYLNFYRFNRNDNFNTLIIWRAPWELDNKWSAKRVLLDLHDVPNPKEFTPERLKNVDKIMVKSRYHRNLIPHVPDEKIEIITNGVDKRFIKIKGARDPYKLIYASSYDRGLFWMLHWGWPIIKREIPEATLDIYYGWNLFDTVHRGNPERMKWKEELVHMMNQKGVTEHGRIGHKELLKKKAEASIHYYATDFEEIDCISVRESALVGCVPVMTDYAALKEKDYGVRVKGDPNARETQEAVANEIVRLIKSGEVEKLRADCQKKAKKETWGEIAKQWVKYL